MFRFDNINANISLIFSIPIIIRISCLKIYKNKYDVAIQNNVKRILLKESLYSFLVLLKQRLFGAIHHPVNPI